MALKYDNHDDLLRVNAVLDAYAEWFGHIILAVFYDQSLPKRPDNFEKWVEELKKSKEIDVRQLNQVEKLYQDLSKAENILVQASQKSEKPDLGHFEDYKNLYDNFVLLLRRFEKDASTEDLFDVETGLRSKKAMDSDLSREMERLGRKGLGFCLVLCRIDNADNESKKALKPLSSAIKQCLRSFDDAYHLSEFEFLLTLKQTDIKGGQAAVQRLQKIMFEHKIDSTMSYCLSQPVAQQDLSELLAGMSEDLNKSGIAGSIIEYQDISALERYVSSL